MRLTADEIAEVTGGRLLAGDADTAVEEFTIDSRLAADGAAFVAVRAMRDGHDFVADAFRRGARVAVVTRPVGSPPPGCAVVMVTDPPAALARLGRAARGRLHEGAVVVGITGSAGKTATKDLVAGAVAAAKRVHASRESYNNESGVPLTLLGAPAGAEIVVVEMGARAAGDIAGLCEIACPTVGIITNIGLAHAGLLGGRAGVAATKGELLDALPTDGLAVLPAGDALAAALIARSAAPALTIGVDADRADVTATDIALDESLRPSFTLHSPWGVVALRVALRGQHQVLNAAMAATVALHVGVPAEAVAEGLAGVDAAPGRMTLVTTSGGAVVLDDTYNASPTSTSAAVRALAALSVTGARTAVLGEMRELGEHAEREHEAIGQLVADCGIDHLVVVGAAAGGIARGARAAGLDDVVTVEDAERAHARVTPLDPKGAVLVKASRAVGLDRLVELLTDGDVTA